MAFALPALPFGAKDLEPHMSAETLEYHHGKHHKSYVDKVNSWVDEKKLAGLSLVEVINKAVETKDKGLFNNAAQAWNHNFFWLGLAKAGQKPSGKLASLIEESFGSTEALLEKLAAEAVGHFGSGWAWLVLKDGKLAITSYHDGDTPVAHKEIKPLLTLDVWEHAYYIDYRNARPKYAKDVLSNIINWEFVAKNLDGEGVSRGDLKQA
ncbi:superoxide dismutase [Zymomonas mobilis]|uniref:Superoxide dismutase n=1 Tax=Zymomonas mobilis subsp. mobilis (strain ATCC 10988 / DSM 424 / LMG 404 / NCIMB 8938 / NRRL B-806 / ZM1) TaxID=555217 RepID=A0A0H3G4S1_ZYMMA|nr:superoxide dismutase [Zymomonas mobilis]AEH62109.1 Superoxide dismutase [Zymomonas mobilis subsp. mobilis ATCC 10988]TQL30232.1 Fe-Mn family superoxide dismutase [Zymomonas mobilis]